MVDVLRYPGLLFILYWLTTVVMIPLTCLPRVKFGTRLFVIFLVLLVVAVTAIRCRSIDPKVYFQRCIDLKFGPGMWTTAAFGLLYIILDVLSSELDAFWLSGVTLLFGSLSSLVLFHLLIKKYIGPSVTLGSNLESKNCKTKDTKEKGS